MMKRIARAVAVAGAIALATPASADFCLQMSGGLSGDLGFFRFKGALPKGANQIVTLRGRGAKLPDPVFGTATVASDKSYVQLSATFFIDAEQGQFDVSISGPGFTSGSGRSGYGVYGLPNTVTVNVVNCSCETTPCP